MKKGLLTFIFFFQIFTQVNAQEGSLVALHGMLTNSRSLHSIKKAFSCSPLDIYLWDYQSRRSTFEDHASCLVSFLQQVACSKPGCPIHFITHSSGALVLRAALNMPGCPMEAKIGKAVLLAPPNKGSSLARRFRDVSMARLALGNRSGWELMNYEECNIQQCLGTFPLSMEILVIAGTKGRKLLFCESNDGVITVDETALETPFYWETFHVNHSELLTSRCVLCAANRFILCYPSCCDSEEQPELLNEDSGQNGINSCGSSCYLDNTY